MSAGIPLAPAAMAEFLDKIKSPDGGTRMAAWKSAGPMGAAAVAPLGDLAAGSDKGTAKAATEAIQNIVHYAARPGGQEAAAVSAELLKVAASNKPHMVRANALYLVGYIGDANAIPGLVSLLSDTDLREDARLALEHIPGMASLDALRRAQRQALADNSDFNINLQQSLYNRRLNSKTVGIQVPKK